MHCAFHAIGKTEMELPDVRTDVEGSQHVDIYPIVWKNFKKNGYATLLNEDEPRYNVFHHRYTNLVKILKRQKDREHQKQMDFQTHSLLKRMDNTGYFQGWLMKHKK